MVQYVFTPWRDRHELLLVRQQLYPGFSTSSSNSITGPRSAASVVRSGNDGINQGNPDDRRRNQHKAVARVSMWMQRGNCPHMVESTALLTAAMLTDEEGTASENAASSSYAARAAYSAAFSRFVTGLLDGHQDKQRKQSMYSIAKTIGLPATFVELRHQSTHEQLPSLSKLRSAAKKALIWIWGYYWQHLGEDTDDPCKTAVLAYLREENEVKSHALLKELEKWPRDQVLRTIEELKGKLPGNKAFLKCAKLSRELMEVEASSSKDDAMVTDTDMQEPEASQPQIEETDHPGGLADPDPDRKSEKVEEQVEDYGWSQFEGTWKPKPIGII